MNLSGRIQGMILTTGTIRSFPSSEYAFCRKAGLRFDEELELQPGMNVRPRGSQLQQGTLLARAGTC